MTGALLGIGATLFLAMLAFAWNFSARMNAVETLAKNAVDRATFAEVAGQVKFIYEHIINPMIKKAVDAGLLGHASPLRMNVEVLREHDDLLKHVREYYLTEGQKLGDWQLVEAITDKFRKEFEEISSSKGIALDALAISAVFYVRPDMEIFKQWETKESDS